MKYFLLSDTFYPRPLEDLIEGDDISGDFDSDPVPSSDQPFFMIVANGSSSTIINYFIGASSFLVTVLVFALLIWSARQVLSILKRSFWL